MATQERIIGPKNSPMGLVTGGQVIAPFQYALDGNEFLACSCTVLTAAVNIVMLVRTMQPDGKIQVEKFGYRHTTPGVAQTAYFSAGVGAIMGLSVFEETNAFPGNPWGDNFCTVSITRGQGSGATPVATLVQSYITKYFAANWPGLPSRSPLEGPGRWTTIVSTPQSIGVATWQILMPPFQRMRLTAIGFNLITSAVPGVRQPVFGLHVGAQLPVVFYSVATHGPSINKQYMLIAGAPDKDTSAFGAQQVGIAQRITMTVSDFWTVLLASGDVGDTISDAVLYGERWEEPS